jgi:hypothetical protein
MSYEEASTTLNLSIPWIDGSRHRKNKARMRVPKMVKNGYYSILHVSAAFEEDKYL